MESTPVRSDGRWARQRRPVVKIGIFVPAYQAASTLDSVFERIPSELWERLVGIVVVVDGCIDGTESVVRGWMERDARVQLVLHPYNQGYGPSVRDGIEAITRTDCDIAVCLHADGQYPPELILPLALRMQERKLDLLQGSRHLSGGALQGGMPLYKILAGKLLVKLENFVFGARMTDYHSGFVFYSRRALQSIPFQRLGTSFDFDLQAIACACTLRLSVGEESIPTRYANEVSHLNPFTYGLRVLMVLWRFRRGDFRRLCGVEG
jgi:glycosyltransferase involved in cell wall biosynthesis